MSWTATDEPTGAMTYRGFKVAGTRVAGCMPLRDGGEAPPHWLPYISTQDVDATVRRARELGANVLMEGMDIPDVGRVAVGQDPAGALFGLWSAPTT